MGEYRLPAETAVLISILLVHHREDVYPEPFAFRPERFLGVKPGTYTWLPFGGGTRRCLGACRWRWPSSAWCSRRSPGAPISPRSTRPPRRPGTATSR